MAEQEREKLVIQIDVDQAAANRARQAIASVRADEQKLAEDFRKLGPIADTSVDLIEGRFDLLEEQVALARQETRLFEMDLDSLGSSGESRLRQLADGAEYSSEALEQLRRDALAAGDAVERIPSRAGGSGGVDVGRVGSVGTQILGGLGQSEAANAVGLVGDAAEAITTLNPAMLALTAAGGAAALVVDQITQAYQRQVDIGTDLANRQIGIADLVAGGATTADAEAQLARIRASYASLIAQTDDALTAAGSVRDLLALQADNPAMGASYARDIAQIVRDAGFTSKEALLAFAETVDTQMLDLNRSADDLRTAIESGVFSSNDAIAEAEANAAAWEDINAQILEQMGQAFNAERERLDFATEIDQMTLEQRAQLAATLRERQADLQAAVDAFRGTGWEQLPTVEADLAAVNEQLEMLGDVTESTADRLAASAAAQAQYNELTDRVFKAITEQADAQAKYQQALTAYNEAVAASEAKIVELRDNATADIADSEAKAQKDSLKALDDYHDRVRRAEQQFANDAFDAVRSRNVDAYIAAQNALKKEQEQADEAYKDQIESIKDRLDEQIATVLQRLGEQVRNAERAAANEVTAKRRALDQADANQQNANRNMIALQMQYQNNEYTIRAQAYNDLANQAYAAGYVTVMQYTAGVNAALAAQAGGGGTGGGYGGGGGRIAPTPLSVMPGTRSGTTNYITVNTATDRRTVTALSNDQARRVLYEVLQD